MTPDICAIRYFCTCLLLTCQQLFLVHRRRQSKKSSELEASPQTRDSMLSGYHEKDVDDKAVKHKSHELGGTQILEAPQGIDSPAPHVHELPDQRY